MNHQYFFGLVILSQGVFFSAHLKVNVSELVVLVCDWQFGYACDLHDILERELGELGCLFVLANAGVVHGEEVIKFADGWVVLTFPEGILKFLHFIDPGSLVKEFLLDAPFQCQQTALGAVVAMGLK